jgi:hypothetical protein
VRFGANDLPTLFFIAKSDDRNRVDYGMRLDSRCAPYGDEPVFPYWREFEPPPPVRTRSMGSVVPSAMAMGVPATRQGGAVTMQRPAVLQRTGSQGSDVTHEPHE